MCGSRCPGLPGANRANTTSRRVRPRTRLQLRWHSHSCPLLFFIAVLSRTQPDACSSTRLGLILLVLCSASTTFAAPVPAFWPGEIYCWRQAQPARPEVLGFQACEGLEKVRLNCLPWFLSFPFPFTQGADPLSLQYDSGATRECTWLATAVLGTP